MHGTAEWGPYQTFGEITNSTVTSRNFQTDENGGIVNAFYLILASIRQKLSAFHKVQWLHFTGAVD